MEERHFDQSWTLETLGSLIEIRKRKNEKPKKELTKEILQKSSALPALLCTVYVMNISVASRVPYLSKGSKKRRILHLLKTSDGHAH